MLAAIGAAHADVRPVMPRLVLVMTVDVQDPLAVRRPTGTEVQVIRMCRHLNPIRAVDVAGPDLIPLRAGQVNATRCALGLRLRP